MTIRPSLAIDINNTKTKGAIAVTGDNGEIDGILYIIAFNLNRYLLSRSKYSHIYKIIIAMSLEKSQLYYILKF